MPLVSCTHLGRSIAVLDFRPNWEGGFRLQPRFPGDIVQGLTGRENRTAEAESLRFSASVSFVLPEAEAAALRNGLAALGDTLVGLPLFPDFLLGAQWGARIFEPECIYDFGASVIRARGASLSAGVAYAPLLVGHLDRLPSIVALTDGLGEIEVTLHEDSPFAFRVGINASVAAGTWPSGLTPNWATSPVEHPQNGLGFESIGRGRERAITGREEAFRWGQEAEFFLRDRGQISTLLGFFAASQGARTPFTQPAWFNPGEATAEAPHSTLVRFASDNLSVSFLTDTLATVALRVAQVPWELVPPSGESAVQASRATFYRISYLIPSAPVWRYTDWERDLTRSGDGTYSAGFLAHASIRQGLTLEREEVDLESFIFTGNPLLYAQPHLREARLLLEVREGDPANPDAAALVFAGEIKPPTFDGERIRAKAVWLGGLLERPVPRYLMQHGCNTWIFSAACGLSKAAYQKTGTLTSLSGAVLTVTTAAADAAGAFAGGWIEVGAGWNWERRAIKASSPSGGAQLLTIDRPLRQAASGQDVVFYRGCDGLPATCQALGNYANFRGLPFIPRDNPTLVASTANATPRKK